jgi:hypothetical protein
VRLRKKRKDSAWDSRLAYYKTLPSLHCSSFTHGVEIRVTSTKETLSRSTVTSNSTMILLFPALVFCTSRALDSSTTHLPPQRYMIYEEFSRSAKIFLPFS